MAKQIFKKNDEKDYSLPFIPVKQFIKPPAIQMANAEIVEEKERCLPPIPIIQRILPPSIQEPETRFKIKESAIQERKEFLNKISYSDKLKDPRWQKKRLQIFNRDKWKCKLCADDTTTLQVHHKEYFKNTEPWDYLDTNFITLCEHCHLEITTYKDNIEDIHLKKVKVKKTKISDNTHRIIVTNFGKTICISEYNEGKRIYNILLPSAIIKNIF